jgi:hypothetical protein
MNGFLKAAVVATLLGASAAASASTFDFSYTFADGQEVTGDFTGTTTNGGQSVTDISNIQVSLNGVAFAPVTVSGVTYGNSTLQANTWNTASGGAFDNTTPVTVYANGALNNFVFSDVDASTNTSPDYEFAYINDATNGIFQVVAANYLQTDAFSTAEGNSTQLALDASGAASNWSLKEVAPVPIPAALGLFASGLGLFGARGRRRRAN